MSAVPHAPSSLDHEPRRPEPLRRRSALKEAGGPRSNKSVDFAELDMVVLLPKHPHNTLGKLGPPSPLKPPAAFDALAAPGRCLSLPMQPPFVHVLWPEDQRYEGPVDAQGAPHGTGPMQISGQLRVYDSTWHHGRCTRIVGLPAVPDDVLAYRPPLQTNASTGAVPAPCTDDSKGPQRLTVEQHASSSKGSWWRRWRREP